MTRAAAATDPAVNPSAHRFSVDPAEIAKFSAMAESWWDPAGKFRPLHRLNPVRLAYIRDRAAARFGREAQAPRPLAGLSPGRYRLRRRAALRSLWRAWVRR